MTEVLAIVTARGGSKGLPGKNIRPFLGRPLIAWSVEAGLSAKTVTRVIVSTDDDAIAEAGREAGAEVPFMRPPELAKDDTLDHPVFVHALEWLQERESYCPDLVVHLRPTSPLRPDGLVDEGVGRMEADQSADSLRVVCEPANNPFKMWRIAGDYMSPLIELDMFEPFNQSRQNLEKVYWQIGTFDVVRPRVILEMGGMSGQSIIPMVVAQNLAVDIDDDLSFRRAEEICHAYGMGDKA